MLALSWNIQQPGGLGSRETSNWRDDFYYLEKVMLSNISSNRNAIVQKKIETLKLSENIL